MTINDAVLQNRERVVLALRQLYLFLITRFLANTPVSVGIGYPVGWVTCCATLAIYYRIRVKRNVGSITT